MSTSRDLIVRITANVTAFTDAMERISRAVRDSQAEFAGFLRAAANKDRALTALRRRRLSDWAVSRAVQ